MEGLQEEMQRRPSAHLAHLEGHHGLSTFLHHEVQVGNGANDVDRLYVVIVGGEFSRDPGVSGDALGRGR